MAIALIAGTTLFVIYDWRVNSLTGVFAYDNASPLNLVTIYVL